MNVSLPTIMKALDLVPENTLLMSKREKGPYRQYSCLGNNKVCEVDLGFLEPDGKYIGFLLLIDIFCRRIWAKPIKSKKRDEVITALRIIFKESGNFEQVRPFRI